MNQRIAVIGTGFRPQGNREPPPEIAAIVGQGFTAELLEIPDGVFPADPAARALCDVQYHEAGLRAQAEGFDAVYINTVGDYGLAELRQSLEIPVTGSGESTVRAAASCGPFAIVTIWPPSLRFLLERVLSDSGTADRLVGITHLSKDGDLGSLADEENFVTRMRGCSLSVLQAMAGARDRAIEEQGAAAVVLGCTCMAPAAAALPAHDAVPTLEPMTLGYRFTEYCLRHHISPQDAEESRLAQLVAGFNIYA